MAEVKKVTTDSFNEDVVNSKKPIVVYFWAEWCQPCKQMGPVYDDYAGSQEKVNLCKVEVDANQQLTQPYNIMGIPTLLLFKDGKVAGQHTGAMSLDELTKFAEQ